MRIAVNRTCAPHLGLDAFLRLARDAGAAGVEIRTDIAGQELADGSDPRDVAARIADAGLAVASVNALQRVNDWNPARESEARAIVAQAAALGAPGLVLCPAHLPGDDRPAPEAARRLEEGLRGLRPILSDHGITGYLEPLGMRHSTMTRQAQALAAIDAIGAAGDYALCHDTFQSFRCGDDGIVAGRIGLVHVSGITRMDLAPGDLTEPDRGLVGVVDRVGNTDRLRALRAAGYAGWVSVEPFDPAVQQSPDLPRALARSIARLRDIIAA